MLSISNLMCDHRAGNERLRYGHRAEQRSGESADPAFENPPRPVVVWAVTQACNLRCVHCYASATAEPSQGELTAAEAAALLDNLREFNVPAILFSGGEPLVRHDALSLIQYAQSIGLRATLSTNGLLINEATADRLARMGLQYVGISLDGTRRRHDTLRGMRGAFDQTLAAIRRCRERGIRVGVRFTVHGLNHDDLDAVIDLCVDQGVQRLCVYHLAYAGRGGTMRKVDLTGPQTRRIVDRIVDRTRQCHRQGHHLEVLTVGNHADAAYILLKLEDEAPQRFTEVRDRLRGTGGNGSGCHIASIDPRGGVHYDQFSWHYTCGNVRQSPFSRIWTEARDPRLSVLRDRRAHLPPRCRQCRFLDVCNGNLRTRAEAATGDWLAEDPACYLTDAEIGVT